MTYNNNMERASDPAGTGQTARWASNAGALAWAVSVTSILVAVVSLVLAVRQAVISDDTSTILTHQTLTPFITAGFAVLGALIASRRARNPIGWIFVTVGLFYALIALCAALIKINTPGSTIYNWSYWIGTWLWIPAALLPATFVPLVFPDGHLPSPRWQIVKWSSVLGLVLVLLGVMFHPGSLESLGQGEANPFGIPTAGPVLDAALTLSIIFLVFGVFGSLAGFLVRFRRSAGIEREQIKWLAYALVIYFFLGVSTSTFAWLWPEFRWGMELSIVATDVGILAIAAASAIAILRYRLYDIDLIINRTLVYTALIIVVVLLYGLVVGALGAVFQGWSSGFLSLLATGLAAVLIQPARDRLQRQINHLMYGERDDPYAVLSGLSRRLEGSLSPETALQAVVEAIAHALKLPYVAVALRQEDHFEIAASYGPAAEEPAQIPLVDQGETVGQLWLSTRSPRELFTPGEQRLLADIARHIGVTAHTVLLTQNLHRLAEDLQRSREELVKSREEERRRLRRDLHDELGPQLASLKLNLDVARNLVSRDPRAAEALLLDLRAQSQSIIADIRRLVYDLRPPALDELGLVGAIREYTRQIASQDGLQIRLDGSNQLPPLPAAVEVAAYRIALEALANFVRHSQGSTCRVTLAVNDTHLQLEIWDDGRGLPEEIQPGVGLNSMRERAVELGGTCRIEALPSGGTRVLARLPLE